MIRWFYISALLDGTTVSIYLQDGTLAQSPQIINAFQFLDFSSTSTDYYHVSADKPIQVAQFAQSSEFETHTDTDAFMILLEALSSFKSSSYKYCSMETPLGAFTETLHITIAAAYKAGLLLDGSPLSGVTWIDMATTPYSITRVGVNGGVHTLSHSSGELFTAFLYGQRDLDTYAIPIPPTPLSYIFTASALSLDEALAGWMVGVDDTTTVTTLGGVDDTTTVTTLGGVDDTTTVTTVGGVDDTTTVTTLRGVDKTTTVTTLRGVDDTTTVTTVGGVDDTTTVTTPVTTPTESTTTSCTLTLCK